MKIDLSREQVTVVLLVVGLAVATVAVSPGMVFGPGDGPDDAKSGVTYTSSPSDNTPERAPSSSFEDSEFMSLPGGYTSTSTPDASEPPEVRASAGAQTMQVTVTEQDGDVALELEDDRVHDGRWVSIPAKWFQQELGKTPEVAYVDHSSGSEYETRLYTRGDSVAFYVEEFSTNTVTFSGEVNVSGDFADGSQAQYDLSDYDSASDPVVNLTGVESTESETVSAGGASDGEQLAVDVSGTQQPTDGSVTFTGNAKSVDRNPSGAVSPGDTTSLTLDGNRQPTGPANGQPQLAVWLDKSFSNSKTISPEYGSSANTELTLSWDGDRIQDVSWTVHASEVYDESYDMYVDVGSTSYKVGSGTVPGGSRNQDSGSASGLSIDTSGVSQVTFRITNSVVSFGTASASAVGQVDITADSGVDSHSFSFDATGEKHTTPLALDGSGETIDWSGDVPVPVNYELTYEDEYQTDSPSIDIDGDGSAEASVSGYMSDGETVTRDLSSLSLSDDTATVSMDGYTADVSVSYTEHTLPEDVSVELNGNTTTHSGTLADGETVQYNLSKSSLREGTNYLNVSVGDGSLSSDAPTPTVAVDYTHDATDQQDVDYGGGQWTETYNVSETYASSRSSAELTVPFQSNVYQIQNIETQVNRSGWSSVATANYNLSGSTLTVDLVGVYGATIPDGTTIDVRTTGISVDTIASTIDVTQATAPGQPLNSTVKIVDWGPDSALDISGTPSGDRVHYVADATWQPDEYSDLEGNGTHVLHLPNASADNTFTVETLPLRIEPRSGDAHVSVPDGRVNRSEPVYRITPGDTVGDAYDVTFTNASDGEDYVLWSETNEIVVDSGTASSPLTLTDDEDNVAIFQFMLDDGTTSSSSSSSDSDAGGVPAPMPTTGGDTNFLPLIGLAVAGGLVIVASRNDGSVAETGASAGQRIESTLGGIPIAGPALGKGLGGLVESLGGLLEGIVGNQTVALGIVAALLLGAVQGGIIEVPQSSLTFIVVAGVGIFSLVALQEFGEFTFERWAAVLASTTIVAVQSLSSESLLTAIVNSDVWPILAISGVYLAFRFIQGIRQPDQVTNVQLQTNQNDGNDGDSGS